MRNQKKLLSALTVCFLLILGVPFLSVGFAQEPAVTETSTEATQEEGALEEPAPTEQPGTVTMDFKEADINTVLRLLSLKSGVNIVAGPEVQGTITIRLENVPWERALEVVLRTYGYVYERADNIIRVTTSEKMAQEELITETFFLEYIQPSKKTDTGTPQAADVGKDIVDILSTTLSERGRVKMVAQSNAIVVTDTASNVSKIREVIRKLDRPMSQVFIDSRVIKTQLDKGENLGIKWTTQNMGISAGARRPATFPFATAKDTDKEHILPFAETFFPRVSGSTTTSGTSTVSTATVNTSDPRAFPFINPTISGQTFTFGTLDFSSFAALLSMLESRSNTKVVSNPRIVVLNNQTAKVKVGSEIPIPSFERNESTGSFEVTGFDYRDVGVVLNVTPHVNSVEEILVDLKPEVSSLGATISFTSTLSAPSFDVTNAETQVLIRSGETIAIGGLRENKVAISEQQIPYLSSIPMIGKIFRSKRQTEGSSNRNVETLFFVTVTLVDTEGQPAGKKREKEKASLLAKETVRSQPVVTTPPLAPAAAGTR